MSVAGRHQRLRLDGELADAYVDRDFDITAFPTPGLVMDVGCGRGDHLQELERDGHAAVGVDVDEHRAAGSAGGGAFASCSGCAEELPAASASLDGVVSERRPVLHGRAARGGGDGARPQAGRAWPLCFIGAGYYLRYLPAPSALPFRIYGLRALVNTWGYALSGKRLPGFLGDTIYQSERRLAAYYRAQRPGAAAEDGGAEVPGAARSSPITPSRRRCA